MTNINTDENKGFKKEPKGFIALSILLIIFVTASFMLFNSLLLKQANEIMQENILDNSIQTINNTASSITDSAKKFEDSLSVVSKAHSIEMLSDQTGG